MTGLTRLPGRVNRFETSFCFWLRTLTVNPRAAANTA